jgi:hypothetical protein
MAALYGPDVASGTPTGPAMSCLWSSPLLFPLCHLTFIFTLPNLAYSLRADSNIVPPIFPDSLLLKAESLSLSLSSDACMHKSERGSKGEDQSLSIQTAISKSPEAGQSGYSPLTDPWSPIQVPYPHQLDWDRKGGLVFGRGEIHSPPWSQGRW